MLNRSAVPDVGVSLAVLVAIGSAIPCSTGAQAASTAVVIPDEVSCAACRISVRHVATLGSSDGPGSLSALTRSIATDKRGQYWIISNGDMPSVFDSNGAFVRHVGTKGRGPQEFMIPSQVVALPGDSMLVFDVELQRASVIAPGGNAVRWLAVPFELLNTTPVAWPTNVWASGPFNTREAAGWPLHRYSAVDSRATPSVSFGPDRGELRPGATESWHALAMSRNGTVWAADDIRFRVTEWTALGEKLRVFQRTSPHFSGNAGPVRLNPREPPPAIVRAIYEDGSGLLWVFVSVPSATWRTAWTNFPDDVPRGRWETSRPLMEVTKLWRTMVEVIDPAQARVVARQFVSDWITAALPNGRAAAVLTAEDGTARTRILEFTLQRQ